MRSWVHLRGPVIQANGRLTFEDDLRSGGLLCFTTQWASINTGLVDGMVTPGGNRGWLGVERCQLCSWHLSTPSNFASRIHPTAQSDIGKQQCVTEFHCVWSVVWWLIVHQNGDYLYPSQYSQTMWMISSLRRKHSNSKTQYIPGKQVLLRSWLWKIYSFIYLIWQRF